MSLPFVLSEPGAEPVVVSGHFSVSAARVYKAWTDADEILQWFGPGDNPLSYARCDVRVGGRWQFGFERGAGTEDVLMGEYREVVPNKRLVFTWQHQTRSTAGTETTSESLVTVTFDETDIGTRLHLTHQRIAADDGRRGVGSGWSGSFASLQRLFTGATATV